MHKSAEEMRLPVDIDAQPLVQAAAALRPVIHGYHEEIERGGRALTADIGQRRAAQPPPDDDCGDGGADALTLGVRQGRSQQQAHQRGPERA